MQTTEEELSSACQKNQEKFHQQWRQTEREKKDYFVCRWKIMPSLVFRYCCGTNETHSMDSDSKNLITLVLNTYLDIKLDIMAGIM